ncbi:M50 family metallopeptidase [Candidatus Oleimmundimicrobium sp.]|uniref:M50 family metallopeptidase n=1 Tax=Candidatus Oleimmundimicrobium sp. TaxID=3060597 RepID=UPI00271B99B0|nr:M50 family metallopeptidase [Candidatus Oleimmundimicrobium sp.]MDO8885456.1 M50 family metallopeptidase [Candidatus Oleimmundimicrobium sp.]
MVLAVIFGKIILTILGIGLLIFVHEFGHFIAAKFLNIKVYEFVLGYGPKLISLKRGDTVYGVAAFPLGGYVKLEDINPEDISGKETRLRVLGDQPWGKRVCVLLGGPFMNFILPVFLIAIIFMIGVPTPTTTIEEVILGYPAVKAGFKAGDKIISIEGEKIEAWDEVTNTIKKSPNKTLNFVVLRNNKKVEIVTKIIEEDGHGFLGVEVKMTTRKFNIFSALYQGLKATIEIIWMTLKSIFLLITRKHLEGFTGKIIGPIGLVKEISIGIQEGIIVYLGILAQMSVGLGIANLIPIPPLDGGKLAFMGYELIAKKPPKVQTIFTIQAIGVALLIFLMIVVTFSDISGFFMAGSR